MYVSISEADSLGSAQGTCTTLPDIEQADLPGAGGREHPPPAKGPSAGCDEGPVPVALRSFDRDAVWRSSTTLKGSSPRLPQTVALRLASLSTSSAGAFFCK